MTNDMCNLSQGIWKSAKEETAIKMINNNEPDEKIREYSGLTQKEIDALRDELTAKV